GGDGGRAAGERPGLPAAAVGSTAAEGRASHPGRGDHYRRSGGSAQRDTTGNAGVVGPGRLGHSGGRDLAMSIELHYDGKVTCEFGEVAAVFGSSKTFGVVHDVAPLILVDGNRGWDDIARGWALVGVGVNCDGRYLRVSANNGSWVWELVT